MKRQKQIPDYDIDETIQSIENPEMDIINKARGDIIDILKDNLSEHELQKIKGRGK